MHPARGPRPGNRGLAPVRTMWLVIALCLVFTMGLVSFAAGACWGASRVLAEVRKAAGRRGPGIATRPLPLATRVGGSSDVVDVTHEPQLVVAEEPCPN